MESVDETPIAKTKADLPAFSRINTDTVKSDLTRRLNSNRNEIKELLGCGEGYTWKTLMEPLEELSDELNNFWAPISHLHTVVDSPSLRNVYHQCLPLLSDYHTELSHNQDLYKAIYSIGNGLEYQRLNSAQRKIIDNYLRDFKLSGVSLPPEQKNDFLNSLKNCRN